VFVHVQVLSSPACMGPDKTLKHPGEAIPECIRSGGCGMLSAIWYVPGPKVTGVPSDEPGKEGGSGLFAPPPTNIMNAEGAGKPGHCWPVAH
jgi:hypothetical protein